MTSSGSPSNQLAPWVRWEVLAWLLLLAAAVMLRFWDLGARVMTHDESIHAFYGYELLRKGNYVHDPVYHGPLLYHLNALVFYFLGATDATARAIAAVAGTVLIAATWLLRPFVGRAGAFAAALFVTLSPTLLFYSRQVWMDVHVALFTLLWIYGAFRYLNDRGRRFLYLVTGAMALAFVAKETSFIFGALFGVWILVEAIASRRSDPLRAAAAGDLAVLMLGLVLPFAAGASYLALGWNVRDPHATAAMAARGGALVAAHFALAGVCLWLWLRARRRLTAAAGASDAGGMRLRDGAAGMLLFWGVAVLFFTTFFTNLRGGLVSGVVGSLGYWLTQQEVARGSQPWFYYLLLAVLYDVLPLVAGGFAFVAAAARLRKPAWDPAAGDLPPAGAAAAPAVDPYGVGAAAEGPAIARTDRRGFLSFLLWWTLATWCAYLVAGEKMPWLLTHMVLPLCLLAGWGVGRLAWAATRERAGAGAVLLVAGGALLPVLAALWIAGEPFSGETREAVADTMEWVVRGVVLALVVVLLLRAAWRIGPRQAGRLLALGGAGLLLALTVRSGLRLCYRTYDLATEHLSYAQGSPDVKRAMREIELISERSAGDRELFVAYDDQSSWPFVWYLRDYPKSRTWGTQATFAQGAPVIITGPKNRDSAWPLVASGYVKREYRLIWWPRQEYATMGPGDLAELLRDPERRRRLWRMAMHRDYSHLDAVKWDPRQEFDLYVREDVAPLGVASFGGADVPGGAAAAPSGAAGGAQIAPQPTAIFAGVYDGTTLAQPTDVTIAADGARVVVDAGNHRVLVLERDGTLRRAFGSRCDVGQGEASGCVDGDGAGPLELGDGQLNEPWGVAAAPSGDLFVGDTWNHRVQRFDGDGRFLRKWGRFGNAPTVGALDAAEPVFFGPRGIAFGFDGDLVVADTGNKRLVRFSAAGEPLGVVGSGGVGTEHFDEPVGIATDANGTLLVADAWNQRVKRLDRRYLTVGVWRVPDWRSESVADKPFLAVDAGGLIYASDPGGGRVWVFEASGRLAATLVLPPLASGKPRPLGIAVDDSARELLVVDQAGARVLVYPLPLVER